jgi:FtsP/CotA-like multicopper oxidase with cupredoxin domain
VNTTETVILDDLLVGQDGMPVPYNAAEADHALMGRFGNISLINGQTTYAATVPSGSVVRYHFVNAANARPYRLIFTDAQMKLVGGDSGRYEKEQMVDAVTIAPSERVTVDVLFGATGTSKLQSATPIGTMDLGSITVKNGAARPSYADSFRTLRMNADVTASIDPFRSSFSKSPDQTLKLSIELPGMPGMHSMNMSGDDGIEWADLMPGMNVRATKTNTQWKLIDEATGAANENISYSFTKGDHVKIRIVNDAHSPHPMQHPIHFHGNRFLILSDNGVENTNLVWKDTVLVPVGHTIDILLDASNVGDWMLHCHIAEHLMNGMMGSFSIR